MAAAALSLTDTQRGRHFLFGFLYFVQGAIIAYVLVFNNLYLRHFGASAGQLSLLNGLLAQLEDIVLTELFGIDTLAPAQDCITDDYQEKTGKITSGDTTTRAAGIDQQIESVLHQQGHRDYHRGLCTAVDGQPGQVTCARALYQAG